MTVKELRHASRVAKDAIAADKTGDHLAHAMTVMVNAEGELARRVSAKKLDRNP